MELKLNDNEIRKILVDALAKKLNYTIKPIYEDCFFEAEAEEIKGNGEVDNIYNVKFCWIFNYE